jgi:queuine tRNA-ribosyltransferase
MNIQIVIAMLLIHCRAYVRNKLRPFTHLKLSNIAIRSHNTLKEIQSTRFPYDNFQFHIHHYDSHSKARLSTIVTPHGSIDCPNFVFCGTKAAMKGLTVEQLRAEGSQIMLANTYHLMLTPGSELISKLGGLQKFTNWNGPMLTDSGGYQIFSMGYGSVSNEIKGKRNVESLGWDQTLLKIEEDGATFRSYVDGIIHHLTPEKSIQIQKELGADIILVLDECTPFHVDKAYTEDSMYRSHRWGLRCLEEYKRLDCNGKQALYGIVQGKRSDIAS